MCHFFNFSRRRQTPVCALEGKREETTEFSPAWSVTARYIACPEIQAALDAPDAPRSSKTENLEENDLQQYVVSIHVS